MSTMHCSLLSLGCVFGYAPPADSALTALRALKIAQRRLRPEVRSGLLSMASARTDATFTPEAWRIVFLDQATVGRCRVVAVAARASSEHPDTVEAFSSIKSERVSTLQVIPQNKLLFDSNQALAQVRGISKLMACLSVEYRLLQLPNSPEPVWSLSFYGNGPGLMTRFRVGAETGATEFCPITADLEV